MSRIIYQLFDYVIRRFNAPSADLKADWIFAETPLSAISRFNWSPESPEVRPLLKGPHEDGSSFRADLEQSTSNKKTFMKFVNLTKPMAVPHQIHTYTELLQQIHGDLRIQHPEWVQPNGESPTCDSYEARLMELLDPSTRRGSNESIAGTYRALEQELNEWPGAGTTKAVFGTT
jgi:hypothetical protein